MRAGAHHLMVLDSACCSLHQALCAVQDTVWNIKIVKTGSQRSKNPLLRGEDPHTQETIVRDKVT